MCVELPCGYSSQTMAKAVAYADMILAAVTFATFVLLWQAMCGNWPGLAESIFTQNFIDHYPKYYKCLLDEGFKFLLISIVVLYCLGTLILGYVLLHAASRRNYQSLRIWYLISVGLIITRILICIVIMITAPEGGRIGPCFLGFFNFFYNTLVLAIVKNLIRHIEEDGVALYARKNRYF